jgi:hypothetical protein
MWAETQRDTWLRKIVFSAHEETCVREGRTDATVSQTVLHPAVVPQSQCHAVRDVWYYGPCLCVQVSPPSVTQRTDRVHMRERPNRHRCNCHWCFCFVFFYLIDLVIFLSVFVTGVEGGWGGCGPVNHMLLFVFEVGWNWNVCVFLKHLWNTECRNYDEIFLLPERLSFCVYISCLNTCDL